MIDRTKILLAIAIFSLIFLCSDFLYSLKIDDLEPESIEGFRNRRRKGRRGLRKRYRRPYWFRKSRCSGSGCSFYDKYGYYRNMDDYYEHNQYRFKYPSYPLVYSDYPNDYFIDKYFTDTPLRNYFLRRLYGSIDF